MSIRRRDQLLKKIGITQYKLKRLYVLAGDIVIKLPVETRLVIVSDRLPVLTDSLVVDVLRTLHLKLMQVQVLTTNQLSLLQQDAHHYRWLIGVKSSKLFTGIQLTSPILSELHYNPRAKRALWKQIYQYQLDL
ncbi:DNA polymerase III subunit psi [Candidatus Erwinia haradaeae]|uniref:DNA polymerase III subunit psi n=1 Tax=Candidatus Erwinia haradaeae TaxID=1922217 RepID=A0A451DHI5_9GAMM|nr:DNA polymerase III subunit psi [Candidatus Erwinia haradaeae]VFP86075.1 DNA polymerase III subunit psi [Candidatus Erwinia haradaeae]